MTSTYLSYLTFERSYGRPLGPVDLSGGDSDSDIRAETDYFRANIGKVSTGAELAADERLFNYVMTAFGMTDQIGNPDLVVDVLDQGVFDPFDPSRKTASPANAIDGMARDFWFDRDLVFSFEKEAQIEGAIDRFVDRTGGGPDYAAEINYFRNTMPMIASGEDVIANSALRDFLFTAYDLQDEAGNQELIARALDAGTYNPKAATPKEEALANTLQDSRFNTLAKAFAFNEVGDLNTQNKPFVDQVASRYNKEVLTAEAKAKASEGRRDEPLQKFYQREIDYFRDNIGKVRSSDDLLADERLYRFALTAFDLESQIQSRALVGKVLEEGVADEKSLANQLIDKKYREFAAAFAFAESGDRNVRNPNFAEQVIEKFTRVKVETDAGEDNVGVRLAAYFDRKTTNLNSWFQILGDQALREVVFTALDLPDEMQQTNPDKLVEIFENRIKLEELNDPEKKAKFIERFTLLYDIKNGAPGVGSNTLTLFGLDAAGGSGNGIVAIDPATFSATLF